MCLCVFASLRSIDHIVVVDEGAAVHAAGHQPLAVGDDCVCIHAECHMIHGAVGRTDIALAATYNVFHRSHAGLGGFCVIELKEGQLAAATHIEKEVLTVTRQIESFFQCQSNLVGIEVHSSLHVFADQG